MIVAALLLAAQAQPPHRAPCYRDGAQPVTLAGTIGVATAPGDAAAGQPGYRYATLTLDRPICVHGHGTMVPAARVVAIVTDRTNEQLPFRFKGQHASVTGRIERTSRRSQPPQSVLILHPQISPDD